MVNMHFTPEYEPPAVEAPSTLWFVFHRGKLLIKIENERCTIPAASDLGKCASALIRKQYLGKLGHRPCYAAELPTSEIEEAQLTYRDLRALFGMLPESLIWVAGRANQLVYWNQTHLYCGSCGHATEDKRDERAKICPQCGLINYPRLSPAVIMAVLRNDRILLARNKRFKLPFYSVLAGFVEPGETLEECVKREICEEVGLAVKNIRYFGSQPWPFPNSLMIAFVTDYATGEIRVDGSEIIDAAWFARDRLPQIPPKISIARQLIDWFINNR